VRNQDLVLSTDAIPGGEITKWEWFASEVEAGSFYNLKVKLCHTSRTALSRNFGANYDGNTPVEVYSKASQYLNPGVGKWFGFDFAKTFDYDGKKNFIIEVEWSGDSGGLVYNYWSPATARCVYNYNGGTVYLANYVHYMRITLEPNAVAPTSLGRVKSIFR
jgi:hypothetical protein